VTTKHRICILCWADLPANTKLGVCLCKRCRPIVAEADRVSQKGPVSASGETGDSGEKPDKTEGRGQ
jgi:hypothetical protein